jgi:hypothetical protein
VRNGLQVARLEPHRKRHRGSIACAPRTAHSTRRPARTTGPLRFHGHAQVFHQVARRRGEGVSRATAADDWAPSSGQWRSLRARSPLRRQVHSLSDPGGSHPDRAGAGASEAGDYTPQLASLVAIHLGLLSGTPRRRVEAPPSPQISLGAWRARRESGPARGLRAGVATVPASSAARARPVSARAARQAFRRARSSDARRRVRSVCVREARRRELGDYDSGVGRPVGRGGDFAADSVRRGDFAADLVRRFADPRSCLAF